MTPTDPIATRFEPGAPQQGDFIPLCVPHMSGREVDNLRACIETNWVSSAGPFVNQFEEMVAERLGVQHAVATASGTAALHLALLAAGVGPGDHVLVPTITFIAPANAVTYVQADPIFVDAEPNHWQVDPEALRSILEEDCREVKGQTVYGPTGRPIKAILPVHVLGHPCDMAALSEVAMDYDLQIIEDASEALGAECRGKPVGRHGLVAALSFNGNKMITTGGGGMLVTDETELAEQARHLSTQAKKDPVAYIHDRVGFNYRLTNLQASIGCAQMEELDTHLKAKARIARGYRSLLDGIDGVKVQPEASWANSSSWLTAARIIRPDAPSPMTLVDGLASRGIQARPLWQPMHRSPAFEGAAHGPCDIADELHNSVLCLPSSVGLTERQMERVVTALEQELTLP